MGVFSSVSRRILGLRKSAAVGVLEAIFAFGDKSPRTRLSSSLEGVPGPIAGEWEERDSGGRMAIDIVDVERKDYSIEHLKVFQSNS